MNFLSGSLGQIIGGGLMTLKCFLLASTALFTTLAATSYSQAQEGTAGISVMENSPGASSPASWGVSFYSLGSLAQQQIENGGASVFTYNYLALNYKLSKTKRFSVR